jgi:ABC-type cobalt transport system substrate-binding protein
MTFDRILIVVLMIAVILLTMAVYFLARDVAEWSGVLNTIQTIIKQFAPGMNT